MFYHQKTKGIVNFKACIWKAVRRSVEAEAGCEIDLPVFTVVQGVVVLVEGHHTIPLLQVLTDILHYSSLLSESNRQMLVYG